jgi:hypothetical protein
MPNNNSMEDSKCFVCGEKIPSHHACFWTASCCKHEDFLKYFAKLKQQHTDLQAKHDELAELVREYFDAKTNLDARSIEHRVKKSVETFQAKLNATHGMVKAEAALSKAVEGD